MEDLADIHERMQIFEAMAEGLLQIQIVQKEVSIFGNDSVFANIFSIRKIIERFIKWSFIHHLN